MSRAPEPWWMRLVLGPAAVIVLAGGCVWCLFNGGGA